MYNNIREQSLVVDKEILFSLVIHDPTTTPTLLWDSWAKEEKKTKQLQPKQGRAYLFSASQLPWKTTSHLKLQQRIEMSTSNYLWKNNDEKLVGVEHTNKKKKNIHKQRQENWSVLSF